MACDACRARLGRAHAAPRGHLLWRVRDRRGTGRARRPFRDAGPQRRAEPRPPRGAADRTQFLFRRYPRGADPGGLAARLALEAKGVAPDDAAHRAGYRIFGSKPGAYGAGLQTLIDERIWREDGDLAEAYLGWSQWAFGAGGEGQAERGLFEARLAATDAVLHNQDNREHDLLDSDDYYQFEGGLALAVRH